MWVPVMIICLSIIWGFFLYYIICAIKYSSSDKSK
jgi:hypothetical protein